MPLLNNVFVHVTHLHVSINKIHSTIKSWAQLYFQELISYTMWDIWILSEHSCLHAYQWSPRIFSSVLSLILQSRVHHCLNSTMSSPETLSNALGHFLMCFTMCPFSFGMLANCDLQTWHLENKTKFTSIKSSKSSTIKTISISIHCSKEVYLYR